jgi:hypothetical protein
VISGMSVQGEAVPAVSDIDDEDRMMGSCPCHGPWGLTGESVEPRGGRWMDVLSVRCARCQRAVIFCFDVTSFFIARPGIWSTRAAAG